MQQEIKRLRMKQVGLQKQLKDQHTLILTREKKSKQLMSLIKEAKEGRNGSPGSQGAEDLKLLEHRLVISRKDLFKVQQDKKALETA